VIDVRAVPRAVVCVRYLRQITFLLGWIESVGTTIALWRFVFSPYTSCATAFGSGEIHGVVEPP
jgi:hypothetical protein